MTYDARDIRAARRMAAAYATLEAVPARLAQDPLCATLAEWAYQRRTRLESRVAAALQRDPLTLSLPFGD